MANQDQKRNSQGEFSSDKSRQSSQDPSRNRQDQQKDKQGSMNRSPNENR